MASAEEESGSTGVELDEARRADLSEAGHSPAPHVGLVELDPDALASGWSDVESQWDDDTAHERFLKLCLATNQLGEAGRRYRAVKDADRERAERAQSQIERVIALAMENLSHHRTLPPKPRTRSVLFLIAFGVSAALIFSALWSMVRAL